MPKHVRLNSTKYSFMKMPNKRELQQIAFNHSTDFGFKNFMNLYTKCTAKPYFFLDIDANLVPDNSSSFKKNLLKRV